jgi:hypothetical protein
MLFILVMDVLNCMVVKANNEGLLLPLATRNIHHRVSLYADDVVMFLRPAATDLRMVEDLLHLFGSATGLRTNIQKCSVMLIQCSDDELAIVNAHLPCEVQEFPFKYLGLPLSIKKLNRHNSNRSLTKLQRNSQGGRQT